MIEVTIRAQTTAEFDGWVRRLGLSIEPAVVLSGKLVYEGRGVITDGVVQPVPSSEPETVAEAETKATEAYERVAEKHQAVLAKLADAESEPEPEPAVDPTVLVRDYVKAKGLPAAQKLLEEFGAKRVGDVPDALRAEFVARLRAGVGA